jgi:serine phosphatase RsbU (regulator of sigma subunit)
LGSHNSQRRSGARFFGEDGLEALLAGQAGASADTIAEAVRAAVEGFDRNAPRDDMAVLVLRAEKRAGS